ncbi:MAG TPA: BamA/TamA family outer membrane protein [Bacteroidales bacterium]|nr:BamA/TamA family outer membrane protein [Bacteroidales bacterium]
MRRLVLHLSLLAIFLLAACNTFKYVPKDQYLLHSVKLVQKGILPSDVNYNIYLHQVPNARFLNLLDLNLAIYNLSGRDTSKWINRTLRKLGEEPVIFDQAKNERSRVTLENLLINQGYFNANVQEDVNYKKRRAYVTITMNGNIPYTINKFDFASSGDSLCKWIDRALLSTDIHSGTLLSSEKLDLERERLVLFLQEKGYYAIQKENFYYRVDSMLGNHTANVMLMLQSLTRDSTVNASGSRFMDFSHSVYRFRNVYFMLDVDMASFNRQSATGVNAGGTSIFSLSGYDTLSTDGYKTVYQNKPFISPNALIANCRIIPGQVFDVTKVNRTYARLNSLQYMKYVNIRFAEVPSDATDERPLDCYIVLSQNKRQGLGFDVEGTNTAGDFGVAGNLSYTHRNLFNGSEMFQTKIRGAYEAVSSQAISSFASNYLELGGEVNLTLPEFKAPFLKASFKQKMDATTEFRSAYQLMTRPEFQRTVASMGVRYNWSHQNLRQTFDLFDLSYTYMPWVQPEFASKYLNDTSYLKYSYEDHFILRSAYTFSYSSVPFGSVSRDYRTWRGSIESAGNLLYAGYALAGAPKDANGFYKIGNINFSQYVRGELEFAKSVTLDSKSRLAYRIGVGFAYPYGNSTILPFEKRFYSGGANSVRGWAVRTLGPGSYHNPSNAINFMNQSGDMKLDLNLEYRGTLFWVVEGALFADAGNIWTLNYYSGQPGGQFKWNSFYKQIAGSIGGGIRLAFDYFLIRVDAGMKVYDPSSALNDHWRIRNIDNWDDFALHFAVGYPF